MTSVADRPAVDGAVAAALDRAVDRLLALQTRDGLVEGRARDERDDGRGGSAPAPVPRHPHRGADAASAAAGSARSSATTARGRTFFGGPGRSLRHDRGVRRAPARRRPGRRRAHARARASTSSTQGGIERARVFTKIWLSLFGLWSWEHVPAMPPELIFLPPWAPLNLYDFACWARQTVAALTVVWAYRPVRRIPITLDELRAGGAAAVARAGRRPGLEGVRAARPRAARLRAPARPLASQARAAADGALDPRPPGAGRLLGRDPAALGLLDHGADAAAAIRSTTRSSNGRSTGSTGSRSSTRQGRRLEACQSPVWDTALALIALADAGLAARSSGARARRHAGWLGEEITIRGDWAVRRPDLAPGGWAFEFENDWYPDIDDTAEVVHGAPARRPGTAPSPARPRAARNGRSGCSRATAPGARSTPTTPRRLVRRAPVLRLRRGDRSAERRRHGARGRDARARRARRSTRPCGAAIDWLLREQEADGSWFGRWGANYVYGTGAGGARRSSPPGSRGITKRSGAPSPGSSASRTRTAAGARISGRTSTRSWSGAASPTASQTAWALLALHAAGERGEAARAVSTGWCETQRADGGWDEPWFTGTGFPGDFYINYHLYRLVFPVSALGRYVHGGGA